MIITVPDGYNGHTVQLDTNQVIQEDRDTICLRVVGCTYLFRWVLKTEFYRLINQPTNSQ